MINWNRINNLSEKLKNGNKIYIKKKNRGKFTASAKAAGRSVQEHARAVLNDPNATPLQKKRANFARNAAKWHRKHAEGGNIQSDPVFNGIKTTNNRPYDPILVSYINNKLREAGMTKTKRAAVLANIIEESGVNPYAEGPGGFYGLLQWSKERYTPTGEKNKFAELDNQINYILETEANSTDRKSWTHGGKGSGYNSLNDAIKAFNEDNLESSTRGFTLGYVRPAGGLDSLTNRYNVAKQIYNNPKFYQNGGNLAYTAFLPNSSDIVQPTMTYGVDKNEFVKKWNQKITQTPNQTYIPFLPKAEQVSTLPNDYEPSFPVEPVRPIGIPSWAHVDPSHFKPVPRSKSTDNLEEDFEEKNIVDQPKPNKSEVKDMNNSTVQQKEPQTNREKQIFANQYLQKNLNLTAEQAAALVGVWQAESGFNLNAENKAEKAGKNSAVKSSQYGIGIGQWTHNRHDDFVNFMKGKENTLKNQLDFAIHEIKTKYQDYLRNLRSAANIKDATAYTYVQYVGGNEKNIINVDDLYARVEKMVQRYMKKHMELYGKASNGFERRLKYAMDSLKLLS